MTKFQRDLRGFEMEPIVKLLSARLKEFVDDKHSGNISKVRNILKVDYSSVYRLYHGTLSNAPFFLAYEILKKTDPDTYKSIMSDYFPAEMAKIVEIANSASDPLEDLNQKLACAFGSEMAFSIFIRAQSPLSLTLSTVKDDFGAGGLSLLDKMVSIGLLLIDGDVIRTPFKGKDLNPSEEHLKDHGKMTLQHLSLGLPGTIMANRYQYLNEAGLKRAYEIRKKAMDDLDALSSDPSFAGDKIVLSTIAGGLFSTGAQQ